MKKRILITGSSSYIGNSLMNWFERFDGMYESECISVRGDSWRGKDFSTYDAVLNVAGIAHVDAKSSMESLYYDINCDLAIEIARKAKEAGVKQYIFLSSIIVYGERNSIRESQIITKYTRPNPSNFYGNSKLQAEAGIQKLQSNQFQIAILRLPMIYGRNSKGNYPKLVKLAKICPIFPDIKNKRSMLHIDNLCEFIRLLIVKEDSGIFYPQNKEYVCTTELVKQIAQVYDKKIVTTSLFNPIIFLLGKKVNIVNKVFGTMTYEKAMSEGNGYDYQVVDFKQSIERTEKK